MAFDAVAYLKKALDYSELLQDLQDGFGSDDHRSLTQEEIELLELKGNLCGDWSLVRVKNDINLNLIVGCRFSGTVYLGTTGDRGCAFYCSLENAAIEDNVQLEHSTVMNYIVRSNAAIIRCAEISCAPEAIFGNGVEIPIAIETGGREVLTFAELNVAVAERIAGHRGDRDHLDAYSALIEAYVDRVRSDRGIIGNGASVRDTRIQDAYIGPHAEIDNATLVRNCTVLSGVEEPAMVSHGSYVTDSIVQWGCEVTSLAIVDSSVLTEHSHVERHGKVTQTIVGPNTGVAEGEVTASLLGPFVGFHHQSLLIAAFWPEGKGNIAHGANIGSNHPSRAPDQEIRPGEGLFIGLDTHIKFPSDFTQAPYTLLAAGVLGLPQRLEFPFSLVTVRYENIEGISPAFMEIRPGWVLSDHEIGARARLAAVSGQNLYTVEDIPGLGKNYLREEFRLKGIDAYSFYIGHYALKGLKARLEQDGPAEDR